MRYYQLNEGYSNISPQVFDGLRRDMTVKYAISKNVKLTGVKDIDNYYNNHSEDIKRYFDANTLLRMILPYMSDPSVLNPVKREANEIVSEWMNAVYGELGARQNIKQKWSDIQLLILIADACKNYYFLSTEGDPSTDANVQQQIKDKLCTSMQDLIKELFKDSPKKDKYVAAIQKNFDGISDVRMTLPTELSAPEVKTRFEKSLTDIFTLMHDAAIADPVNKSWYHEPDDYVASRNAVARYLDVSSSDLLAKAIDFMHHFYTSSYAIRDFSGITPYYEEISGRRGYMKDSAENSIPHPSQDELIKAGMAEDDTYKFVILDSEQDLKNINRLEFKSIKIGNTTYHVSQKADGEGDKVIAYVSKSQQLPNYGKLFAMTPIDASKFSGRLPSWMRTLKGAPVWYVTLRPEVTGKTAKSGVAFSNYVGSHLHNSTNRDAEGNVRLDPIMKNVLGFCRVLNRANADGKTGAIEKICNNLQNIFRSFARALKAKGVADEVVDEMVVGVYNNVNASEPQQQVVSRVVDGDDLDI